VRRVIEALSKIERKLAFFGVHTFICAALLLNMTLNCGDPPSLQASAFGVVFGPDPVFERLHFQPFSVLRRVHNFVVF
jgi:hypothetical protein